MVKWNLQVRNSDETLQRKSYNGNTGASSTITRNAAGRKVNQQALFHTKDMDGLLEMELVAVVCVYVEITKIVTNKSLTVVFLCPSSDHFTVLCYRSDLFSCCQLFAT